MNSKLSLKAAKPYDYAVIIGRFQPVHRGHIPTFEKAFEVADNVICVIGSSNMPRTIKNPFTSGERKSMILEALNEYDLLNSSRSISFVEVEDTVYQDSEWERQVKSKVTDIALAEHNLEEITERLNEILGHEVSVNEATTLLHLQGANTEEGKLVKQYLDLSDRKVDSKICILGHKKDQSSYYMNNFSGWEVVDTGAWVEFKHDIPVSATHIRDMWFEGKLGSAVGNLSESTINYIREWMESNEQAFLDLKEEYDHVKKYRAETQVGPFPVQFITTDAVVRQGDQVLLIRRGTSPGKGLWALPGGFVNHNETIKDACVRELMEETQISLQKHVLLNAIREEKIFDYPERSLRGRTITVAYSLELNSALPLPKVRGADDAVMAWWFSTDEIFNMRDEIFEDHYDIIRYFIARNSR